MQKWEYLFQHVDITNAGQDALNGLGAEGWELVAVQKIGESVHVCFLKRPKQ